MICRSLQTPCAAVFALLLLCSCSSGPGIRQPLPSVAAIGSSTFEQTLGSVAGEAFLPGNRIQTLNNGAEIFPAMLSAIRSAQRTINFETFVFYHGDVPQQFADALTERARAGVKVNVIIDGFGGAKSRRYHSELRAAGVQLEIYNQPLLFDVWRANYRTHRKLLIVDGRIGFIGGVGIGDDWGGSARHPKEWRDIHYRIEGPVVAQLQGGFSENWLETRREVLQGADYFPALKAAGNARAAVFVSAPRHQQYSVELMYHLALASAQKTLRIANAYFVPDDTLTEAICRAARRGVKVQIIMPGEHMDQKAVRRASRKRWPQLLKAGVELYEYEPTMMHTKLLIADDYFVSLGSANFDPRSLRINDEANLNVLDQRFAAEQRAIFERDLRRSRRIGPDAKPIGSPADLPLGVIQTPLEGQL